MKMITKILMGTALTVSVPNAAQASVVIDIVQSGADVVSTVSGSVDLTGFTQAGPANNLLAIRGDRGFIGTGAEGALDQYFGYTGTSSVWGPGTFLTAATSTSGDSFAFNSLVDSFLVSTPRVFVPVGYVSGAAINSTATFAGATLDSLGLAPNSFVFTAASGDTLTVNISAIGAVPEPATWAFMIFGFGAIGGAMRSRRKAVTKVSYA